MQQLGHITGPVGLINAEGYWDPFVSLLENFADNGFIQRRFVDALIVEPTPAAALDAFAGWVPLGSKWDNA